MGLTCFGRRRLACECTQARGERVARGPKPPALMPQAHPAPHEVVGFGIGEDDPAIPGQEKNGETGGRDRHAERVGDCFHSAQEVMDRRRALQMRREGFQELPFRKLHPMCCVRLFHKEATAHRFRCFDDAVDDLVPAGRFDDNIVNCRDQIIAAVWYRHCDAPLSSRNPKA